MTAADRFSILIGFLSLMTGILGAMLRFLWKLSATLSNLSTRVGRLESDQASALTISPPRRHRKR